MKNEPIKPADVCLGNFISCFGKTEMVCSIIQIGKDSWYIEHRKWHQGNNPMPGDMLMNAYPIPLTDQWKKCLRIDKYVFPEWVEYVHQAQNYMRFYADVNLLEIMDWDKLPKEG